MRALGSDAAEITGVEIKRDCLSLAGFEREAPESSQGNARSSGRFWKLQVELRDLVAGAIADVSDLRGNLNAWRTIGTLIRHL